MDVPASVLESVSALRRPIVIGHVRPDADCLGSMLGLARVLSDAGIVARVSLPEGTVSRRLAFLSEWTAVNAASSAEFNAADGFIVVDTARLSRCSVPKTLGDDWPAGRAIVNIDHHESNTRFGTINWVVPDAAGAAELVFHLIRTGGWPITPPVASLLFAGIHSDTVGFSLATTTPAALAAAADLVRLGADVGAIGNRLYRSHDRREFDLLRLIFDNTRVTSDGAIAYSTASHAELTRLGCTAADVDDQVSIPRSIEGIRMAILFTEGRPGKTRVNLRGEDGVNVLALATDLGGGGHTSSAGAIVDAPLNDAVPRVLALASEDLKP